MEHGILGQYVSCKETELVEEMKKYQLEILGVSEVKKRGNGKKAIDNVRCVFWGEGRQVESRCSNNHVRKVGQMFKGVQVFQ